jgi:hypothetical protein
MRSPSCGSAASVVSAPTSYSSRTGATSKPSWRSTSTTTTPTGRTGPYSSDPPRRPTGSRATIRRHTDALDTAFAAHGAEVIRTPPQTPVANSFGERWVCTVRRECLDRLLILGERHLRAGLGEYLATTTPIAPTAPSTNDPPNPPNPPAVPVAAWHLSSEITGRFRYWSRNDRSASARVHPACRRRPAR